MLLGVPPAEKKSKKTGKLKLSYWKAAQGKEVLGNPRLPEVLVEFDRNKVTPDVMMEVEDVLTNGHYSYERAHTASVAATGIFKWVKATRDYFYIFKEIFGEKGNMFGIFLYILLNLLALSLAMSLESSLASSL